MTDYCDSIEFNTFFSILKPSIDIKEQSKLVRIQSKSELLLVRESKNVKHCLNRVSIFHSIVDNENRESKKSSSLVKCLKMVSGPAKSIEN